MPIDTSEKKAEKAKNIIKWTKNAYKTYDETVKTIDEYVSKAQNMIKLIEKIEQAASHGEIYVMTDAERNEFGNSGSAKLQRDYDNLIERIADARETAAKWLQDKLDAISKLENKSGFDDAQKLAQKANEEYIANWLEQKVAEKIKSMNN